MVTIRDVAKLAGVSVATVSRVLNKNGYVKRETEQKVRQAIEMLNFEMNQVARGLASKKTNTIALILPNITNPFFAEIAKAVEDKAREYNYTVILRNSDFEGMKEISYLEVLRRRYVDGVIFASNALGQDTIQYLQRNNIPRVVLDRTLTHDNSVDICSKNFEGAQTAVNHLLEVGCKKIAHIYGPQDLKTSRDRLHGYESIARSYDWYTPSLLVPGDFEIRGGMRAVKELLEKHPDIDGIFAGNDLMAIGALKMLIQMGIRVPEDVAICGFDGIELTTVTEPELTTVAQPIYQMGTLAVEMLMDKIGKSEQQEMKYRLETKLIQRRSTQRGAGK